MKRSVTVLTGAAAGTLAALLLRLRRRREGAPAPAADPRAEELRRKLAEARGTVADEDDFEAAGMGPETILEEKPGGAPTIPGEDVEEARRRVHDDARAAAEEMRRSGDGEDA